jgi:hypothetical protein
MDGNSSVGGDSGMFNSFMYGNNFHNAEPNGLKNGSNMMNTNNI